MARPTVHRVPLRQSHAALYIPPRTSAFAFGLPQSRRLTSLPTETDRGSQPCTLNQTTAMHTDSAVTGNAPQLSGSSSSAKRQNSDLKSSAANTPARTSTPPPPSERGRNDSKLNAIGGSDRRLRTSTRTGDGTRTSAFDPDALDQALSRELHRPQRESTPGASPHRKRQRVNADRLAKPTMPSPPMVNP